MRLRYKPRGSLLVRLIGSGEERSIELLFHWDPTVRIFVGVLFGGVAGSFLATLVVRWPAGRSVVFGRSYCDACGVVLGARSLVPIASFLVQHGYCRTCGNGIDRTHFAIEIAAATIGAVSLVASPGWGGLAGATFGWALLTLAALDLGYLWLPNRLTLSLAAIGLAVGAVGLQPTFANRLIGMTSGYVALAVIAEVYRRARGRVGLGGGDPKLFAAIGAWLGWHALPIILFGASIAGLLTAGVLHLAGRPIDSAKAWPFGAFLALAAWIGWLAGVAQ